MRHLDGNTLAGALGDLVRFDVTTARLRCTGCGVVAELATTHVYRSDAGSVARCRDCGAVLVTLVETDDRTFVSFSGTIEIPRSATGSAPGA
jgi:ribosomal protein S27E